MNPESHLDLELVAARLRQGADDLSLFGGMLIAVLSAALPAHLVEVRREGRLKARLGGREPAVLAVHVDLDGRRFEIERDGVGARPVTVIRHVSRGVVLSTEACSADAWCRELTGELVRVAGADSAAVEALQRLTSTA
ncbi:hypothetical protein [Dactylosporangium sp. CS-033363]|uniref:hypothetical protein n=1 Tax=Dactylosporangium sp. CS-033363 TaxID=3239935 RepID=UPI003D8EB171